MHEILWMGWIVFYFCQMFDLMKNHRFIGEFNQWFRKCQRKGSKTSTKTYEKYKEKKVTKVKSILASNKNKCFHDVIKERKRENKGWLCDAIYSYFAGTQIFFVTPHSSSRSL